MNNNSEEQQHGRPTRGPPNAAAPFLRDRIIQQQQRLVPQSNNDTSNLASLLLGSARVGNLRATPHHLSLPPGISDILQLTGGSGATTENLALSRILAGHGQDQLQHSHHVPTQDSQPTASWASSLNGSTLTPHEHVALLLSLQRQSTSSRGRGQEGIRQARATAPLRPLPAAALGTRNQFPRQVQPIVPATIQPSSFRLQGNHSNSQIVADSSLRAMDGGDRKRKAGEQDTDKNHSSSGSSLCTSTSSKDAEKKKRARLSVAKNSFPMPSCSTKRDVHFNRLLSYHALWSELEDSEMQEEIFRQRIYQCGKVKFVGLTRSIRKKKNIR